MMTEQTHQQTTSITWLTRILRTYIALMVPVLLVIASVRMIMTPAFLAFEYNRPGFPEDIYGFTTEDRFQYAPYAMEYLLNGADVDYLGDLTLPSGAPLYNERELQHMVDVKIVTQYAFLFGLISALLVIVSGYALWRTNRAQLRQGLMTGGLLTLALIAAIILLSVLSWDVFFTGFHSMFFQEGTWQFLYSDTLIRLFPEQFWFDAALVLGSLTAVGAMIVILITWKWGQTARV
jgi:integral membrane protein (TIGR01906 family)